MGIWVELARGRWISAVSSAWTSVSSSRMRVPLVFGIPAIKPLHVGSSIVPDRKSEHHATAKGLTHLPHATVVLEFV